MRIPYPERSQFVLPIQEALRGAQQSPLSAVEVLLEPGGYSGGYEVVVDLRDSATFECDFQGSDPTRFPARIRAAAWALKLEDRSGRFRIAHDDGLLTIHPLKENAVIPWEPGSVVKRSTLHERFGGQRQSGIVTPRQAPVIFLITSEAGLEHGYEDHWDQEGCFHYYGEGQVGDMTFTGGNRALRDHERDGKQVFLWQRIEENKTHLRLMGEVRCSEHHEERGEDRDGEQRRVIVFVLELCEALWSREQFEGRFRAQLKHIAQPARAQTPRVGAPGKRRVWELLYERDPEVAASVLARAAGRCEGCLQDAPFMDRWGLPYLIVTHVDPLGEGGADTEGNAMALCPNCSAQVHHGRERRSFRQSLKRRLRRGASS